jgi:DME family drug/metabolite transporter
MPTEPPRRAVLFVAAAALLWSSGGLFIKIAPMPALAVACGRALIATLFYLAVLRPDLRKARFTTAAAYAACVVTFVTATKLTTAANAIFLQYTGPAYVLLLSPLVLREPFRPIDALCVGLSLAGMSLFFVDKLETGQLAGNVLGAVSGVFFALTVLFLRRDAKSGAGDAIPSTTLGNVFAAVGTVPFAGALAHLSGTGVLVLVYLGVMQLGVSYWLFVRGVRHVPAAEASLISMLEPVCNPLWVLLGTGERPGPWSVAGGAVVLGAVALRTLVKQ